MGTDLRQSGIDVGGDMAWGTHFCLLYETNDDFLDAAMSYLGAASKAASSAKQHAALLLDGRGDYADSVSWAIRSSRSRSSQ